MAVIDTKWYRGTTIRDLKLKKNWMFINFEIIKNLEPYLKKVHLAQGSPLEEEFFKQNNHVEYCWNREVYFISILTAIFFNSAFSRKLYL